MKGGKRLTEEERVLILCKKVLLGIRKHGAISLWSSDPQEIWDYKKQIKKALKEINEVLKRDDEPEYCTCGHAHGMHSADIWACDDCGKPVKEE